MRHVLLGAAMVLVLGGCRAGPSSGEVERGRVRLAADAVVPAPRDLFEAEWAARRSVAAGREPDSYALLYDALRAIGV